METTLLLCDYAEAINGKLYIMGGGWSVCTPGPRTLALSVKILVPWDQANEKHKLSVSLRDDDNNVVEFGTPPRKVVNDGAFEVGRPPKVKKGTPLDFIVAMVFNGLPLEPDTHYRWQVEINGEPAADVSFSTVKPTSP